MSIEQIVTQKQIHINFKNPDKVARKFSPGFLFVVLRIEPRAFTCQVITLTLSQIAGPQKKKNAINNAGEKLIKICK